MLSAATYSFMGIIKDYKLSESFYCFSQLITVSTNRYLGHAVPHQSQGCLFHMQSGSSAAPEIAAEAWGGTVQEGAQPHHLLQI